MAGENFKKKSNLMYVHNITKTSLAMQANADATNTFSENLVLNIVDRLKALDNDEISLNVKLNQRKSECIELNH